MSFVLTPGARTVYASMQSPQETPVVDTPAPSPETPNQRAEAVRLGKWPVQVAASQGAIQPDMHGPQRTDPAEGIPIHAYSPFDERRNREYPCPPGGCDFETGHVLVKLAAGVEVASSARQESGEFTGDAALDAALSSQGIVRLEPIFPTAEPPQPNEQIVDPDGQALPKPDLTRWYVAAFESSTADVYATVESLAKAPGVAWAEPDYLRKPVGDLTGTGGLEIPQEIGMLAEQSRAPDFTDPLYGQQWHLPAIHAPEAWAYLQSQGLPPGGSSDVIVAVIDTGVDYTHPDLAANMWVNAPEFNGVTGVDDDGNGYVDDKYGADTVTPDGNPIDDHGHGTHVAGIIAARADNGIGGVGVAYTSRIMALKAAQYSGVLATSDIAEAIYYAVQKGAQVINMSFGGYARSQMEEDALAVAFGQAVLVAAAGNEANVNLPCVLGRDLYPAAYNWVLGIMARSQYPDADGNYLAGFSNYDCEAQDTHEYELMAPGVDIWSSLPASQYAAWDGTSMAAPVVSGLAALARTRWGDTVTYSSRFIMGQLASTGSMVRAYTPPGGSPVFYRAPDGSAALTNYPQPQLSYLEHWVFDTAMQAAGNDNDGLVDAGETVDLGIVIRNHWGKADPVTVTLDAWANGAVLPDPYVTVISGTVSYGAIGSFNEDDNGLLYDPQGAVVGTQHPFRFSVDATTPNDHIIPMRLTMTAGNGLNPPDPSAPYHFQSWFYLIVQRGEELPTIISSDMVLTKDHFWILPGQTLIESGVAVTVTEGTQIQFGSVIVNNPYLQVEGSLRIQGTQEEPVELFGSEMLSNRLAHIRNLGTTTISYARAMNPYLGQGFSFEDPYCPLTSIDHLYATSDRWIDRWSISALHLTDSAVENMLGGMRTFTNGLLNGPMTVDTVLINRWIPEPWISYSYMEIGGGNTGLTGPISNSVFMQYNDETMPLVWGQYNSVHAYTNNAFLSPLWDPNSAHWMHFNVIGMGRSDVVSLAHNYWDTTSTAVIDEMIWDQNDDFNIGRLEYQPLIADPSATMYPFAVDLQLSTASGSDVTLVGAEPVTFTVTFNRDMDTTVQPQVWFGPAAPYTDYPIAPIDNGWSDARTWQGAYTITPITGDGYQFVRIVGAHAADDPWLVIGNDSGRFRFEIVTSGTSAMNLQATGGEGYVDLAWTQDDFDLLAGYNLYKSASQNGTYTRVNQTIIPPAQHAYRDTAVQPGVPVYYKFKVVKSDMSESDFSNTATATPLDTIPPAINHTPVTQAPPGLSLSISADVTDNVGVQNVTLFYRHTGATPYQTLAMVRTTDNRYSATIPGSSVAPPGLEYYIEASDGISTVRSGRPEYPYPVQVVDRPVVTGVTPNHGPSAGGTVVTLSGSNFKPGATVTFGGAAANNVVVQSAGEITCVTPSHFPASVDVVVTNPGGQTGTLLQGYRYESDVVSMSLPAGSGPQHAVVEVPVNLASADGLVAASLTVSFDNSVLHALDASTGSLTPGWSVAANTGTPGQIRLSMATPGGSVTGSGALALLRFDVVGAPGSSSALHLTNVSLNSGAIPVQTADGSFGVDQVYSVGGTIEFWNSGVVSDTLLTLSGNRLYTARSNASGVYTVGGAIPGAYTLTPSKSDEANGIGAYDASLALQHDAGLILQTGYPATAADVDRSGVVDSMDAYYILQKSVDLLALPFPGAGKVWRFDPATHSYANLTSNLTGQNFTAVLLGDVSGNWTSDPPAPPEQPAGSATLSLDDLLAVPGERIIADLSADLTQAQLYAADLAVTYDPSLLTFVSATPGPAAAGFLTAVNASQSGQLSLALAGAAPITLDGVLFTLTFDVAGPSGSSSSLAFHRAEINEGQIGVQTNDGSVTVVQRRVLALTPGWNLLALPLSPLTAFRAQSLLDEVNAHGGVCTEIDRWLNGGWDAHINTLPFNDFAVEPGKGYFLKCTAASQWTVEGFAFEIAVPVALQPGWNLIGLPHPQSGYTAQSLLDAIASQSGACTEVDRWLNGGWDAHIGGLPFNNFAVEPDKGYFLKCSQASTFVPS